MKGSEIMNINENPYGSLSGQFDKWDLKKIENGDIKGCPVCGCKDTGIKHTQGACGSTDSFYFCQKCGVVRMGL